MEQYVNRSSREDHVGNNCVLIKSAQWGGSRTVGVGVEKSLRGGRSELRCVSIESSEYCLDLRRKSKINNGFMGEG